MEYVIQLLELELNATAGALYGLDPMYSPNHIEKLTNEKKQLEKAISILKDGNNAGS